MLGEIFKEVALNVAGNVISDVAPTVIGVGATVASAGIGMAVDKITDVQKVKKMQKVLGVEKDIYLNDAIQYYDLLDNINAKDFGSRKAKLLKV